MAQRIGGSKWLVALAVAASLTACAPKPPVADTHADEAAIRQTLANLVQRINQGDLGFVDVFAKDAVIIAPSAPDIVGYDAIRNLYAGIMQTTAMNVQFSTQEVVVAGDLAYEHGTYTLKMTDKASGKVVQDVRNKHLHIFKRQPDGSWKTWRMMTSSAEPAAEHK